MGTPIAEDVTPINHRTWRNKGSFLLLVLIGKNKQPLEMERLIRRAGLLQGGCSGEELKPNSPVPLLSPLNSSQLSTPTPSPTPHPHVPYQQEGF